MAGCERQEALVGDEDQADGKLQAVIEINLKPGLRFFIAGQFGSTLAAHWLGSASSLLAGKGAFAVIQPVYRNE